jgi:hypothetical protein
MKDSDARQLELECGLPQDSHRPNDDELMRRIDKIITDTTRNVRPYLNRMVKDVERLLQGSFIRTPSSNLLDDMIQGLEKDIRKFVTEVTALKRWSQPDPPDSPSHHLQ